MIGRVRAALRVPARARLHRLRARLNAGRHGGPRRADGRPVVAIALVEHLGDIVAAQPIARFARTRWPAARTVWVARAPYRELLEAQPDIDEVVEVRCLTEWLHLRRDPAYDHVLDLHLDGRDCAVCKVPLRRSAGVGIHNYYALGNLLDAFCRVAELPPLEDGPRLRIPPETRAAVDRLGLPARFIAVHATSNEVARDWRTDGWRELARRLTAAGWPLVEVGLHGIVGGNARDLCGELTILESAEVIRRAALFIGVDSGPAHIANAVGTPGVVLLGRYGPFAGYLPYSGRYARGDATLLHAEGPASGLDPARVLEAALARLTAAASPLRGASAAGGAGAVGP